MVIFKRAISFILALSAALIAARVWGVTAFASTWLYYTTTNPESAERNYNDGLEFYGIGDSPTFTNNGMVNIKEMFSMYNFAFQNNGTLIFSGSKSSSDFFVGTSSSFINDGIVQITGVYNFGAQENESFINNGTLYLEDIASFNSDGFVNNGTVVVPDDNEIFRSFIESKLNGKGDGQVFTATEFESKVVRYILKYEGLNCDNYWDFDNSQNPTTYEYAAANPGDVTLADPTLPGYEFLGWTGLDVTDPTKNFTFSSNVQQDVTVTAHWKKIVYNITYDLDGGAFYYPDRVNHTYSRGDCPSLALAYKTGYTFTGWVDADDPDEKLLGSGSEYYYLPPSTLGDKRFKAKYIANTDTRYKATCYYENLSGGYDKTEYLFAGQTNETALITPDLYGKDGFTYDSENAQNVLSGVIAADSSLELKLYFKRNTYTITYKSQDGSQTLYTAERKYGEKVGAYKGEIPTKTSDDDLYTFRFDNWAKDEPNRDFGYDMSDVPVSENVTYYAAFKAVRDTSVVIVKWLTDECEGFKSYPEEARIKAGSDYTVSLELENENYYVGTPRWSLGFKMAHVYWYDVETGEHGVDYTMEKDSFDEPVTITIPNIKQDIYIKLVAHYHEEHDFSETDDTIIKNGNCVTDSVVRHFCYKCGKTYDETVSADGHKPGETFEKDEVTHWKICAICEEKIEKAVHTPDSGVVTHEPTHNSTGTKTYTCTVCGYVTKRETLAVIPHSAEGGWESDTIDHFKLCSCGERMETAKHTPDHGTITVEPTYTTEGRIEYRCTVCARLMGEGSVAPLGHKVEAEWQNDLSAHWHNCECGEIHDFGEHVSDGGVVITERTYTDWGETVYSCEICGYLLSTVKQPPLSHKGITVDCEWEKDESGHWIAGCGCGEIHEFAPHTSDNGTITLYPTYEAGGAKEYRCTICGYLLKTEDIPALARPSAPITPNVPSRPSSVTDRPDQAEPSEPDLSETDEPTEPDRPEASGADRPETPESDAPSTKDETDQSDEKDKASAVDGDTSETDRSESGTTTEDKSDESVTTTNESAANAVSIRDDNPATGVAGACPSLVLLLITVVFATGRKKK
ncbi:MAG: InlB B-repeat-containing protein [Bacteroides sp.]|nr:InlB B-repeat-containing protein [Eubacterium sp.]MCM1417371.1 InlB B-repeat-containing protein [Roseburia sp.]MCM1461437.1 InlB B-repeat-containing protein [Bacteroides sp.]